MKVIWTRHSELGWDFETKDERNERWGPPTGEEFSEDVRRRADHTVITDRVVTAICRVGHWHHGRPAGDE